MQIDLPRVLALMGMEAGNLLPAQADCPICKALGKLEIRSQDQVLCRGCWTYLDVLGFYALYTRKTLEGSVLDLKERGLLGFASGEESVYLSKSKRQQALRLIFEMSIKQFRGFVNPSVNAILSHLGCRTHSNEVAKLAPHAFPLFQKSLEGFPLASENAGTLRQWKDYAAVCLPVYKNTLIVGAWLVTVKGVHYLTFEKEDSGAAALVTTVYPTSEMVLVMSNPEHAIRIMIWALMQTGKCAPIVIPYGIVDNPQPYRCRNIVYWSPTNDTKWYLRALKSYGALVVKPELFKGVDFSKEYPLQGNYHRFTKDILDTAMPCHQGFAHHLMTFSSDDARARLTGEVLEANDKAKILSCVQGPDADFISGIVSSSTQAQVITFNGKTITETPDGWICGHERISAAMLHIDEVRPKGELGDGLVVGNIVYNSRAYPFRASLKEVRLDAGEWMINYVVGKSGHVPAMEKKWKSKIFDIAQQFHPPTPVLADQQYGWLDGTLRFPFFAVDRGGIYPIVTPCSGPALALPAPLTPSEGDAFKKAGFCRIFLALLGNLVRTYSGLAGTGILLENEPSVMYRLAAAFGAIPEINPKPDLIRCNTTNPLPTFTEWSEYKLPELFKISGPKNVLLSMDRHSCRLARIAPDWVVLKIGEAIDYQALRAVFIYLPHVLKADPLPVDNENFYRTLAELVKPHIEDPRLCAILTAGIDLDLYNRCRSANEASRILEIMHYLVETERMTVDDTLPGEVIVRHDKFLAATVNQYFKMPSIADITEKLQSAKYLTDVGRGVWKIPKMMWEIYGGLYKTSGVR